MPQSQHSSYNIKYALYSQWFITFCTSAIRRRFDESIKQQTNMSQHDALEAAHVHETSVCVTFGARRFGQHFRDKIDVQNMQRFSPFRTPLFAKPQWSYRFARVMCPPLAEAPCT